MRISDFVFGELHLKTNLRYLLTVLEFGNYGISTKSEIRIPKSEIAICQTRCFNSYVLAENEKRNDSATGAYKRGSNVRRRNFTCALSRPRTVGAHRFARTTR